MASRDRLLLGLDIGGTKTVVALGRASGEILAESRLDNWASGSWSKDIDTLVAHARVLLRGVGIDPDALYAIGASAPGPLNPRTGVVLDAPNVPGWTDVPLMERLYDAFGVQVVLENDANAAALAELRWGAGAGRRSLVYLTMSTGVGAGVILDGRLYRGHRFQAGEIGHIPIVADGRLCACGLRGCLEAYTSGTGVAVRIREDLAAGTQSAIREIATSPEAATARDWIEAVRADDTYALELLDEYLGHLSQGLAIVIHSFDPECIVLGTIIQQNPDLFLEPLRARTRARIWTAYQDVEIVVGELGPRLPAYAGLSVAAIEPEGLTPPEAAPL